MPRKPSLWLWKKRGVYMVTVQGKRYNFGPDKKKAEEKFQRLLCPTCKRPL